MPLGNLRDYVKANQGRIGSAAMLRWAQQIAMGMEHLEQNRLVHRDLAARNVLVRNPAHVAVTDFGLAKMLQHGQEEVKVEGRVPVKWLALECMTHHRFTHKSDVWAYGVSHIFYLPPPQPVAHSGDGVGDPDVRQAPLRRCAHPEGPRDPPERPAPGPALHLLHRTLLHAHQLYPASPSSCEMAIHLGRC